MAIVFIFKLYIRDSSINKDNNQYLEYSKSKLFYHYILIVMYLLMSIDESIDQHYILPLVFLCGVGTLLFVFGMDVLVKGFHLPLPIDSQGFCTYTTYYIMLSMFLFGMGAPILIFGMVVSVLPYCKYFCILFFFYRCSSWVKVH